MGIKLYGSSDDLIKIEGDIYEEFNNDKAYAVFSDGTVAAISYGALGIWRIDCLAFGKFETTLMINKGADSDQYSDVLTIQGYIDWVIFGTERYTKKT